MKVLDLHYSGVVYSKKNSKQIITNHRTGKMMLISNKNAKTMERDMSLQFSDQVKEAKWAHDDGDLYVVEMIITRKDNTRRDLDNMATSILDALVIAGALPDDSIKYVKALNVMDGGVDKFDPHASVKIRTVIG